MSALRTHIEEEIMKPYAEMTKEELVALRKDLKAKYHDFQTKDLRLDMSIMPMDRSS